MKKDVPAFLEKKSELVLPAMVGCCLDDCLLHFFLLIGESVFATLITAGYDIAQVFGCN